MPATVERASGRAVPGHPAGDPRQEEIRWLEELWATAPASEPQLPRRRVRVLARARRRLLASALVLGWPIFLTTLFSLAPASAADAAPPSWAQLLVALMFLSLAASVGGLSSPRIGFLASSLAAVSGLTLALSCFATGHTGLWPAYQLGGFALLAGLSAAGLSRARRDP